MLKPLSFSLLALTLIAAAPLTHAWKYKDELPPGLQKKMERGNELPPGWQKEWHKGDRLDDDLFTRGTIVVPVGKNGTITVDIEGVLMHLNHRTHEIIDILDGRH